MAGRRAKRGAEGTGSMRFGAEICGDLEVLSRKEWLETNGLGGFAASSISGVNTRRYHGLLVAAVKPPTVRMVLLSSVEQTLLVGGASFELSTNQYHDVVRPEGYRLLSEFRPHPIPTWTWEAGGVTLERSVCMIHGENTTVIRYRIVSGGAEEVRLEVRPLTAFRHYHALTHENSGMNRTVVFAPRSCAFTPYEGVPTIYLSHDAASVDPSGFWYRGFEYARERERGLDYQEDIYSPLSLTFDLTTGAMLIASTEPRASTEADSLVDRELDRREQLVARAPSDTLTQRLVRAADQFIVARGDGQTIIAGYPWFTDWSRDTMIALPGLTLSTGRPEIARSILLNFAHYADQGMLPNRFPDTGEEPEYNTVDGTLWYFAAIDEYARHSGDVALIQDQLYNVLADIIDWHVRGTRYGIKVDSDGLLAAGEPGVQLTWMDARIGDWVVTPRSGKAVEIQALWYNALKVMEGFAGRLGKPEEAKRYASMAATAKRSFNALFWNSKWECLYDVVDGPSRDASVRPNQVITLSLAHTMVSRDKAVNILNTVERHLLTPVGLRTLSPEDPHYRPRYEGDPVSRDSAYHQGTVWPWLMGPYLTAWLKAHGGTTAAKRYVEDWLRAFEPHLMDACLGQVSEIYDADEPRRPNGCPAQAWSVAELLRARVALET